MWYPHASPDASDPRALPRHRQQPTAAHQRRPHQSRSAKQTLRCPRVMSVLLHLDPAHTAVESVRIRAPGITAPSRRCAPATSKEVIAMIVELIAMLCAFAGSQSWA